MPQWLCTGPTVLGTPAITSCGLFHQAQAPARESSTPTSRGGIGGDDLEQSVMIEQHTRAAKDEMIEILTAKASKLGASLERAIVAKREFESRTEMLQVCEKQPNDASLIHQPYQVYGT